jgi:hypothetical protein
MFENAKAIPAIMTVRLMMMAGNRFFMKFSIHMRARTM